MAADGGLPTGEFLADSPVFDSAAPPGRRICNALAFFTKSYKAPLVRFWGTKEIKDHVQRLLEERGDTLRSAKALDFPAGNGVTSEVLSKLGAQVQAVDLFPEFFRSHAAPVRRGDLSEDFPLPDSEFDLAICQEGIEHVGNQDHVFREFSRVLKPGGTLIITTPNYSNIKSKLSYLLCESEAFGRIMPPNEFESVWLPEAKPDSGSKEEATPSRVYFGHCFLTGFFRLRLFARLAGLELVGVRESRVNTTSLLYFPLFYPFICLSAWKTKRRFLRKTGQKQLANDLFHWMLSPRLLLENHLILEFKKRPAEGARSAASLASRGDNVSLESFQT